ncbi:MAG: hypothetical protein GC185_03515 [Alphaproteobacteria bacterium]|nr:hypothetical protein [Alphaproteobacteria bacterium]
MTDKGKQKEKQKGKLVLFRHGQTEYNKKHLMTGQTDVPLTEVGEEQAREAGLLIKGIKFDKAFSSTLSRAFNTAALALEKSETNDHLKNPDGSWNIEQRREVIETDVGDFAGRNHKEEPELLAWERHYHEPMPNGESDKQAVDRVRAFFEQELLPRMERGETVLVVSHAGIMRAFDFVLGLEDEPGSPTHDIWMPKKRIPNATPLVIEYEDGQITHSYLIENPKELEAANQNKKPNPPAKKRGNGPKR